MSFSYLIACFLLSVMPDLTTVRHMQDRAVVAAVVAGDAEGFGAVYDKYAAPLYARCRSVLPEDDAADAVLDTFLVAAAKLNGLRDPDRLASWLVAVARNECRRRMDPGRAAEAAGAAEAGPGLAAAGSGPGSAQPVPVATVPVAATRPTVPGPPATQGPPVTSPSPSQTPSPSPSPSPSTTAAQGILQVKPRSLQLTSASGKPVSGSFTITAVGGPVAHFTVRVAAMAANVVVKPAGGSLPAGMSAKVTVTVTSKADLTTHVIVGPGNLTVTVAYKVKA
jgi:hypothetical protein